MGGGAILQRTHCKNYILVESAEDVMYLPRRSAECNFLYPCGHYIEFSLFPGSLRQIPDPKSE